MLREAIKSQISCLRPNSKLLQGIRGTLFSDKSLCLKHVGHTGFHIFNISICVHIYIHTYDGFYHSNSNKYKCPLCSPNLFCLSSLCSLFATVTSQQPSLPGKNHQSTCKNPTGFPHWGCCSSSELN